MNKRIISALTAIAAMSAMLTITAAPAQAQIKGNCTSVFCLAADVYPNPGTNQVLVKDATVSARDGVKRRLKIFIKSDSWTSPTPVLSYKKIINKNYPKGSLLCGSSVGATQHACFPL